MQLTRREKINKNFSLLITELTLEGVNNTEVEKLRKIRNDFEDWCLTEYVEDDGDD